MVDRDDDPGADTAMFRAYVEHGSQPDERPGLAQRPGALVALAVVAVLVVIVLILVM
jgi:hypothetical protein